MASDNLIALFEQFSTKSKKDLLVYEHFERSNLIITPTVVAKRTEIVDSNNVKDVFDKFNTDSKEERLFVERSNQIITPIVVVAKNLVKDSINKGRFELNDMNSLKEISLFNRPAYRDYIITALSNKMVEYDERTSTKEGFDKLYFAINIQRAWIPTATNLTRKSPTSFRIVQEVSNNFQFRRLFLKFHKCKLLEELGRTHMSENEWTNFFDTEKDIIFGKSVWYKCLQAARKEAFIDKRHSTAHGVYMRFENQTELAMVIMDRVLNNGESIPGHFKNFDLIAAEEIANSHTHAVLKHMVENRSDLDNVDDLFGGYFHYNEILTKSIEDIDKSVQQYIFGVGRYRRREDINRKNKADVLKWSEYLVRLKSLLSIRTFYQDIIFALTTDIAGVIRLESGEYFFFVKAGDASGLIYKHNCIGGGTVGHGREASEYEQVTQILPNELILNLFGLNCDILQIVDLREQIKNKVLTKDGEHDHLYDTNPLVVNGKHTRKQVRLKHTTINEVKDKKCKRRETNKTFNYALTAILQEPNKPLSERRMIRSYRLFSIVADNLDMGTNNNKDINKFTGGKAFEDVLPFLVADEHIKKKKLQAQYKYGYQPSVGNKTDVEHYFERDYCLYVNCLCFTHLCSHSWNQSAEAIRKANNDFCFALAKIDRRKHQNNEENKRQLK